MSQNELDGDHGGDHGLTRRSLLRGAGIGALTLGSGSILAACGSTGSSSSSASNSGFSGQGGSPVHGGNFRVGAQGGANTDTLDAHNVLTNTDFARASQLYDPLVRLNNKGQPERALAADLVPNKTGDTWTIKLRPGVTWHDGKPFEAKDVLYTFNRIVKGKYPGAYALGPIDVAASKAIDPHTVVVKFSKPYSTFEEALALHWYLYMVPVGYNPSRPIGCGPFKFQSFTPGRQSVFVRHAQYWDAPKPYVDQVVTININDETAQVNALQSGQVDAIDYLTAASIATLRQSGQNVTISKSGGWVPFTLMIDVKPYSDNRVREAMRLVINRKQMLESVFAGNGQIGNDIFGIYDKFYDASRFPQREQDIEKAKSLLKAAGYSNLSVQLISTPNAPGMTQMPQVFKTQAEAVGINTAVTIQPTTEYFARSYLKVPFSMDYWPYAPYLTTVSQATTKEAPFNFTHFRVPKYDSLYNAATSTLDETKKRELVQEMMDMDYKEGGYMIPLFFPVIDASGPHVHGIEPAVTGQALSTFQFQNFWIAK